MTNKKTLRELAEAYSIAILEKTEGYTIRELQYLNLFIIYAFKAGWELGFQDGYEKRDIEVWEEK